MSIAEQYHFSDFTLAGYREYLREASSKYQFVSYKEALEREHFLLNRHDVDFSVHRSLRLAQEEAALQLKSTYFLHLHSEYYNVLEKEITDLVKAIIALGHDIGLHFDTHYYGIESEAQLDEKLIFERSMLETLFETDIEVFSFHNTTDFTMNCKQLRYGGMLNVYAEFFQAKVTYCSDSNGYWRFQRLLDLVRDGGHSKLQILTHPVWWQDTEMSPWVRMQRSVNGRAAANLNKYVSTLEKFGRENIGWTEDSPTP